MQPKNLISHLHHIKKRKLKKLLETTPYENERDVKSIAKRKGMFNLVKPVNCHSVEQQASPGLTTPLPPD